MVCRRTTLLAHTRRGSHNGWYLVNSALPLTTRLPPANTMRDQLNVPPLIDEFVDGKVAPDASIDWPVTREPFWIAAAMSVRSVLASATAPSTLSRPAPCCSRLAFGSGCAVYCSMALTSGGVSPGLACSISAAAPATAGAAIDVPLIHMCVCCSGCGTLSGCTSVL